MKFIEIIWIIGIILSVIALFIIVSAEIALNALVISTAIFALIWTFIAKKNLSRGSSLRLFAVYLSYSLIFFLLSSIVQIIIKVLLINSITLLSLTWISYISLAIAYLLLVMSAYRLMRIGKEFGFVVETKKIKKILMDKRKAERSKEKRKSVSNNKSHNKK